MSTSTLPFKLEDDISLDSGSYKPVPPNPSGLRMGWLLFGISALAGVYMAIFQVDIPTIYWIASGVLLVVALAISLSQWLEGRTVITVMHDGIQFQSPLRKLKLRWSEIDELWCGKIQGGWRFMVSGLQAAFRFQSLIVLRSGTGKQVRSGFEEGQKIAHHIFRAAGLSHQEQQDDIWIFRRPNASVVEGDGVLR